MDRNQLVLLHSGHSDGSWSTLSQLVTLSEWRLAVKLV
jgi:hypothetical protein